jgi:hypothetical protein
LNNLHTAHLVDQRADVDHALHQSSIGLFGAGLGAGLIGAGACAVILEHFTLVVAVLVMSLFADPQK